jgi:hypothetical protein
MYKIAEKEYELQSSAENSEEMKNNDELIQDFFKNKENPLLLKMSIDEKMKLLYFSAIFFIQGLPLGYIAGTQLLLAE